MVIAVYNPVGEVAQSESVRATTMTGLNGRSVGFVFNHHPAVTGLWAELEKGVELDFRPVGVQRIAKANISMPQPAAQLAKLAAEVDYALVGVGA